MRIIENKIAKLNLSDEEANVVRNSARILFNELCTTNPIIAFIPIRLLMNSYVLKNGIFYKSLDGVPEIDYVRKEGEILHDYLSK